MMNPLVFILLLSAMHSSTGFVNLECMPQQPYVCAGYEIICFCTASSNETIFWDDNNTLSSFSSTQVCNSCTPDTSSAVRLKVINCPSCSNNFTSCLSYNASLGMGNIQIGCSISPDPPGFEKWCVTNCRVPAVPSSCSITSLSYNQSGRLLFIDTAWNSVPDTVDTCPGPNITHYLVQISFQNESVTENVNITECTAERCSHTFKLPSNPPSSYDRVSVAAENMMGVGDARTCTAQTISTRNNLLTGKIDVNSRSDATLNCTFLSGLTGSAICTVQYGTDPTYMNLPYCAQSIETGAAGDTVSVVLRERLNSATTYYYTVSAVSGNITVVVQGTFTTPPYTEPTSTATTAEPTSTPTTENLGAIIGGIMTIVVITVIVVIVIIVVVCYCHQRQQPPPGHVADDQNDIQMVQFGVQGGDARGGEVRNDGREAGGGEVGNNGGNAE